MLNIKQFATENGVAVCVEFDPSVLTPEERIRAFCAENKCGTYGRNYMCPPRIGSLEEIKEKIGAYTRGVLLQYSEEQKVDPENRQEIIRTKDDFHHIILRTEAYLRENGAAETWGLIGGSCGLCEICAVTDDEPCRYPESARASLESIGIDVIELLNNLGLDSEFRADRITWTGAVLYK